MQVYDFQQFGNCSHKTIFTSKVALQYKLFSYSLCHKTLQQGCNKYCTCDKLYCSLATWFPPPWYPPSSISNAPSRSHEASHSHDK